MTPDSNMRMRSIALAAALLISSGVFNAGSRGARAQGNTSPSAGQPQTSGETRSPRLLRQVAPVASPCEGAQASSCPSGCVPKGDICIPEHMANKSDTKSK